MACKDCKKKKTPAPVNIEKIETFVKGFLIVWSLFALYGIFNFIKLIF